MTLSVVLREGMIASRFEALRGLDASPLVGRGEELDFLLRRLGAGHARQWPSRAADGRRRHRQVPHSACLAGPADRAAPYGAGLPLPPHHQDAALHPIITQFVRAAGIRRNDRPEAKLRKLELSLEYSSRPPDEQVSLFAALLSIPGGDRYPLPDLEPQELKKRILAALSDLLRRHCAARPVLALFEDLHWIDPTSLELFDFGGGGGLGPALARGRDGASGIHAALAQSLAYDRDALDAAAAVRRSRR